MQILDLKDLLRVLYVRLKLGVEHDVVAVKFEAVLVVDDDLLNTEQTLDEDVVDLGEALGDRVLAVFRNEILA